MGFFTFGNPDPAFRVPDMDTNVAVRRILQLLNDSTSSGQSGSTNSVGSTMQTLADVVVNNAGVAKQSAGAVAPRGIMVMADKDNAGAIYVGDSTVTNGSGSKRGYQLTASGMASVVIPVNNANLIYVNADNNNDRALITVL